MRNVMSTRQWDRTFPCSSIHKSLQSSADTCDGISSFYFIRTHADWFVLRNEVGLLVDHVKR